MCLCMLLAARPVGEGKRPSEASRLQPSNPLGSLRQLHPEWRRAVHLSPAWIQVKHEFLSPCLFSNSFTTRSDALLCFSDTCCWWGRCVSRKGWTTRSVSVCLSTRQSVTSRTRTHSSTLYVEFYSFIHSFTTREVLLSIFLTVKRWDCFHWKLHADTSMKGCPPPPPPPLFIVGADTPGQGAGHVPWDQRWGSVGYVPALPVSGEQPERRQEPHDRHL